MSVFDTLVDVMCHGSPRIAGLGFIRSADMRA
jgi:hypothetical protein